MGFGVAASSILVVGVLDCTVELDSFQGTLYLLEFNFYKL